MRKTILCTTALLLLLGLATNAQAQKDPSAVIRLKSFDGLVSDALYLAKQAGKGEEAKQLEGFLKVMIGEDGLKGLDTKKPFALYVNVAPNPVDSTGVVMIPVKDQEKLLAFVKTYAAIGKPVNGVHTIEPEGFPESIFVRFSKGYAYATIRDKEAIAANKILAPDKVFAGDTIATVSAAFNFGAVPGDIKETVNGFAALAFAQLKEKAAGDLPEQQKKLVLAVVDEAAKFFKTFMDGAERFAIALNVDQKADDVSFSIDLKAKDGSALAAMIADVASEKSTALGVVSKDSAAQAALHVSLPKSLRKPYEQVLEEAKKSLLKQVPDNPIARKHVPALVEAVMPTLKKGALDLAVDFAGPSKDGKYTIVAAAGIEKGLEIEKVIKTAWKEVPDEFKAEIEKKIKIDFATVGKINVHKINVEDDLNDDTKLIFGKTSVYVAIRDDALMVAFGEDALSALKKALASEPVTGTPFKLQVSMARLAKLIDANQRGVEAIAKKVFKDGKGGDKITTTLKGGKSLQLRFSMQTKLLELFAQMQANQGAN